MESKLPPHNKRRFKSNLGSMFSGNTELKRIHDNNFFKMALSREGHI